MADLIPNDLSQLSDDEFSALCPHDGHAPGPELLSPQAQAVLDAFRAVPDLRDCPSIAAALRAAADQVVPELDEPDWGACNEMRCDIELYTDHQRKRAALLAIVTELENN